MHWPTVIHEILKARSWTQVQLAEAVGSKQSTIASLLRGDATEPRYSLGNRLMLLRDPPQRLKRGSTTQVS